MKKGHLKGLKNKLMSARILIKKYEAIADEMQIEAKKWRAAAAKSGSIEAATEISIEELERQIALDIYGKGMSETFKKVYPVDQIYELPKLRAGAIDKMLIPK